MHIGSRLGPYEITAKLGEGGMGEVYRARDSRLGRDVAIKVSAEHFSDRFEREARAIAALNHPHICTLHDVGPNYLVMELVEGPTLADRIARGPIAVDETLRIARQMADALATAHDKGIVHRDLKPANVKLTPSGAVKVLDFGLAQQTDAEIARSSGRLADEAGADPCGGDCRHHRLHVSGAGARAGRGQARGRLGVRRHPVRNAHGRASVRGCHRVRHAGRGPDQGAGLVADSRGDAAARSTMSDGRSESAASRSRRHRSAAGTRAVKRPRASAVAGMGRCGAAARDARSRGVPPSARAPARAESMRFQIPATVNLAASGNIGLSPDGRYLAFLRSASMASCGCRSAAWIHSRFGRCRERRWPATVLHSGGRRTAGSLRSTPAASSRN